MNKYFEQNLKLVDYIDGMMIVDRDCIIRYYYTAYPEVGNLREQDVIGKSLFQVYPALTRDESYIYRSLTTGESFINYEQEYTSYQGVTVRGSCTALPIKEQGNVTGVIDMFLNTDIWGMEKRLSFDLNLLNILSKDTVKSQETLDDIITQDPRMTIIKERILSTSDIAAPVLVYGKTGTGKELVVNAIHRSSSRRNKPLIKQNCAAIPSTLLESILFGTVRGSFTGAQDSQGLFELANGGTLFLDEINSMELDAQAKLLRVLEEGCIRRLGDNRSREINVKIIAAMNESPEECVKQRKIREDIYYRLCVLRYDIPPLCERRGDIPLLMEHFRTEYNQSLHRNVLSYSDEVFNIFERYPWPGNVRELKNAIEAAFYSSFGTTILAGGIPAYILDSLHWQRCDDGTVSKMPLAEMVGRYESAVIEKAYHQNQKSLTKTALALQISKQSLAYKLKKYQIS